MINTIFLSSCVIYESYCNAFQQPISPKLSQCLSVMKHYISIDIEGCMLQCWFHNTEAMEDSVQVACVKPNAADTAFQIYSMKRSAYAAVLRAFCARSDILSGVLPHSYKFNCEVLLLSK